MPTLKAKPRIRAVAMTLAVDHVVPAVLVAASAVAQAVPAPVDLVDLVRAALAGRVPAVHPVAISVGPDLEAREVLEASVADHAAMTVDRDKIFVINASNARSKHR